MSTSDICTQGWGNHEDNDFEVGTFNLDYYYLYYCTFNSESSSFFSFILHFFIIVVLFLWCFFLMYILSQTASYYFTPTLNTISTKLKLSYDIAGVTFLAFGNGAPDFFSLLASFNGNINILVGIGALLGGSMFVCSVVVGTISILCPCEINKNFFLRDIVFYLVANFLILCLFMIQKINLFFSIILLLLYVGYVLVVIFWNKLFPNSLNTTSENEEELIYNYNVLTEQLKLKNDSFQTAFWYVDKEQLKKNKEKNLSITANKLKKKKKKKNNSSSNTNKDVLNSISSYSFLIIDSDDSDNDEEKNSNPINNNSSTTGSSYNFFNYSTNNTPNNYTYNKLNNQPNNNEDDNEDYSDPDNDLILSFSGGYQPNFDEIIIEDYFATSRGQVITEESPNPYEKTFEDLEIPLYSPYSTPENEYQPKGFLTLPSTELNIVTNPITSYNYQSLERGDDNNLQQSLLYDEVNKENEVNMRIFYANTIKKSNTKKYQSILNQLYWQQWALRRNFRHSVVNNEWINYSQLDKIIYYIVLPVQFLLDITIPNMEENGWNKFYALLHPIIDPLLFIYIFNIGIESNGLAVFLVILTLIFGFVCSFLMYVFTHNSYSPKSRIFLVCWTLLAFVMCIVWVYMLAGELILCLSSVGYFLNLSPTFLGLTVLAWGNSIGDFFTNTSVAKQGLGAMAIAGCYGGPIFNLLVGFASSLIFICVRKLDTTNGASSIVDIKIDSSTWISISFILFTITFSMIAIPYKGYKLDKQLGYTLIGIYILYTAIQGLILII